MVRKIIGACLALVLAVAPGFSAAPVLAEDTGPDPLPNEAIVIATNNGSFTLGDHIASFNPDGSYYKVEKTHVSKGSFSPDGTKLSYDDGCKVYTSNRDGTNEVEISAQYGDSVCLERAVWSPDGTKLLVVYYSNDPQTGTVLEGVATINPDGSDLTLILPNIELAQWSPDATQVVFDQQFTFGTEGRTAVSVANADGSNAHVVVPADLTYEKHSAYWSTDGTRLSYVMWDIATNTHHLQTVATDGTDISTVYTAPNNNSLQFAAWSPDSTKIATMQSPGGPSQPGANCPIMIVNADGSGATVARNTWVNTEALQWWYSATAPDTAAPQVGMPSWSLNPKPVSQTTTFSVPATDDIGVVAAEYFIGDSDPGQGNAASMTVGSGEITTAFGTDFPTGVYKITARAQDAAGNWSTTASDYLVVYDPQGPTFRGKRAVVPALSNGDILPGLIAANQTDKATFGFTAQYNSLGQIHANSDFQFEYKTGAKCNNPAQATNCHSTTVNATNIQWLTAYGTNNSTGVFQGEAQLSIDGVVTNVLVRVTGVDGERLSPTATDQFELRVFQDSDNPNTDQPLYKVNLTPLQRGNIKLVD